MSHAVLSPSGASRWMQCTPSARLEQGFPDSSGDAAKEGTLAHELGELLISMQLGRIFQKQFKTQLKAIQANKFYGPEMQRYCEDYRDYVLECLSEAKMLTADAELFLEQKLDLTDYVPEGFGTSDCAVVADRSLNIIDLKYGKGVMVSAVENKQMMLYALGVLRDLSLIYDIDTVVMTIYQPRLNNISTYEVSTTDLIAWAAAELRPKAAMAFKGEGEFKTGDHCKFCRAKAKCRALAEENLALAKLDFAQPALLTDDEVSSTLLQLERLVTQANALKDYAFEQALWHGKKWPDFKIVEGRSVRKYLDEDKVAQVVIAGGWPEDALYNKKIIGITEMEKLIGKTDMTRMLGELIIKPPGSPTLVPATDKRQEYNSATADFSDDFIIN